MNNALKKFVFSFIFSLLLVFLPLSIIQVYPVSLQEKEVYVESEISYFNCYSVCNAETKNNKKSVSKTKKQKKEASFIVKLFGLFAGFGTLSYVLQKNRSNLDKMEFDNSLYKEACLLGFLCFIIGRIVLSLIINIFFSSPISIAGFSEFFTYGSYLIIIIIFFATRIFCSFGFLIGYFLPVYLLETFFG